VDAAYYDFERANDFWFNRTINVSGALVFKPTNNTSITLEHEYNKRTMEGGQAFTRWRHQVNGVAVTEGSPFYMPDEFVGRRLAQYMVNGALARVIRDNNSSYLKIEQHFPSGWDMRLNASYTERSYFKQSTSTPALWIVDGLTAAQTNTLNTLNGTWTYLDKGFWSGGRAGAHQTIDYREKGLQFDVTKKWDDIGGIKQRSLLTFDWYDSMQDTGTWALSGTPLNNALKAVGLTTTAQINSWLYPDPFNPNVSGYLPLPAFDPSTWKLSSGNHTTSSYYGSLLNHTAELFNGRLVLLGSIRRDWTKFATVGGTSGDNSATTYSVGATYHIVPRKLVAYISDGTGFEPQAKRDANTGEVFPNTETNGVDAGFKGALYDGLFSYSGSIFQIDQKNQIVDNPANPGGIDPNLPASVTGGTTRAKGISFDVAGRVTPNLTVLANIAWTDARIIQNLANPSLVGTHPSGTQTVPPRTYSLAARYSVRSGRLKGFRVGLTYQYSQEYQRIAPVYNGSGVMTSSAYNIDEMSQWGAMLGYSLPKFHKVGVSFTLNVLNLFNEEKMTVAAYYPNGREIRFGARVNF
jgi:outer membrane receptor for ferric coprogen and ferric-rhodotorulic acid